jgi:hypothetical protein
MRKHNIKFATRVGRAKDDRTSHPQSFAHSYANNKDVAGACKCTVT